MCWIKCNSVERANGLWNWIVSLISCKVLPVAVVVVVVGVVIVVVFCSLYCGNENEKYDFLIQRILRARMNTFYKLRLRQSSCTIHSLITARCSRLFTPNVFTDAEIENFNSQFFGDCKTTATNYHSIDSNLFSVWVNLFVRFSHATEMKKKICDIDGLMVSHRQFWIFTSWCGFETGKMRDKIAWNMLAFTMEKPICRRQSIFTLEQHSRMFLFYLWQRWQPFICAKFFGCERRTYRWEWVCECVYACPSLVQLSKIDDEHKYELVLIIMMGNQMEQIYV